MKLLITGGCGFIGSNFINYYFSKLDDNDLIINLDSLYYCSDINNINENIRNNGKYIFYKGNTSNYDLVYSILEKHKITHIINFAAQSHVQNSFTESLQYTQDNIVGTHTLLEACRNYYQESPTDNIVDINNRLFKFIHVSTDEVYGETDDTKMDETSILTPTNPYAATKAGAEMIALSYYKSFNLPIIITRGNNVYGPNQYPEKLIPKFIHLLFKDKPVTIQGDGSHIRGFLHVDDTSSAFEIIMERGEIGEIYNIGCDSKDEYSVSQIAEMIIYKIKSIKIDEDSYQKWITYIKDRPFNDKRYFISNSKLKSLGWIPKIDFDIGLNRLIGKIGKEYLP
jgi:dTDP-glucose 4,6-dehydratase